MWGKLSGPIEATLTWNSADCPLGLILNGPGQRGYFARKDGASPLSLQFAVTDEQFAKGSDWSITIACFRGLGPDPLTFLMKLNFPDPPSASPSKACPVPGQPVVSFSDRKRVCLSWHDMPTTSRQYLAQLRASPRYLSSAIEQRFCKPKVGSSILSTGTSKTL
jgi:hypothetical protein